MLCRVVSIHSASSQRLAWTIYLDRAWSPAARLRSDGAAPEQDHYLDVGGGMCHYVASTA
jgi:hypothetical protein